MFELRFNVTFKSKNGKLVAEVEGTKPIGMDQLTVAEVTEKIAETEQFLEKLTGLKVNIEQVA